MWRLVSGRVSQREFTQRGAHDPVLDWVMNWTRNALPASVFQQIDFIPTRVVVLRLQPKRTRRTCAAITGTDMIFLTGVMKANTKLQPGWKSYRCHLNTPYQKQALFECTWSSGFTLQFPQGPHTKSVTFSVVSIYGESISQIRIRYVMGQAWGQDGWILAKFCFFVCFAFFSGPRRSRSP